MIDSPRVRLALATRGRLITAGLGVLAAVLLLTAAWTAMAPASETTTETVDSSEVSTELSHSATVRTAGAWWPRGTTLRNHPAYLVNASPALDLELATDAPEGTSVVTEVRLERSVGRNGQVVWAENRTLARSERTASGGSVAAEATVDVEAVRERSRRVEQQFAGVGGVQTRIVADVRYDTGDEQDSLAVSQSLSSTATFYWLSGDRTDSETHPETRSVERSVPVDWAQVVVFGLLGLCAAVGAVVVRRREIDDDPAALRHAVERERFEEWISAGKIPTDVGRDYVPIDTLPDLVDVAIDTGQRVVHDRRRDLYAVLVGDLVYYYTPDGEWVSTGGPPPGRGTDEEPPDYGDPDGADGPDGGERALTDGSHPAEFDSSGESDSPDDA